MSTVHSSHRWLGTANIMWFIAIAGTGIGIGFGFVIDFGPNAARSFFAVLCGLPGMILGLGVGAFFYSPRWAASGFLIGALLGALMVAAVVNWDKNNANQQGGADAWVILAVGMGSYAIGGAGFSGLAKYAWDEVKRERIQIREIQHLEKDRYWSFLRRFERHCIRMQYPRTTPLHIALLMLIQLNHEIVAPVVAWCYLALVLLWWLTRRQRTLTGYRVWRKAKGTPSKEDDQGVPRHDPTQEKESDLGSNLPYSIVASKRELSTRVYGALFFLTVSLVMFFIPNGAGGAWYLAWCFLTFGVEQFIHAYRFWQKEKRIALDDSSNEKAAQNTF